MKWKDGELEDYPDGSFDFDESDSSSSAISRIPSKNEKLLNYERIILLGSRVGEVWFQIYVMYLLLPCLPNFSKTFKGSMSAAVHCSLAKRMRQKFSRNDSV
tara:strand:+ start:896 stop:1201 length:306 start_codon:yes stop_codon:yes gene_type:complete